MRPGLSLLVAALLVWGCASRPETPKPSPRETPLAISPEVKAQIERETRKAQRKEELFQAFSRKTDEYQNLLGVCDDISDKEENKNLKESCSARLGDLRRELLELKGRIEEP